MVVSDDITLREYLHLLSRRVKDPPCIDKYDEFLVKVWDFFSLRVAAERYFDSHRHVAISRRGALPVPWLTLRETWRSGGPPEQTITLIAKRNYNDVNALVGNLRKVLTRVRQKVAIGRVQQVDAHCLRWLTRQPGRSAAEKGGAKQEILGIVRVENYNTLENRVFKDFLSRCLALSTMYLRRYNMYPYRDHVNIKAVSRFKNLCIASLELPELESVADLREFPQPNYVLQQDRLYAKVWNAYSDIMRQEDVAEKLWDRRAEVDELYSKCNANIELHCSPRARYDTPLWVCELNGKDPILENPIWDNELAPCDVRQVDGDASQLRLGSTLIVDFTYLWDERDELVYPSSHHNARPFLQNKHRPSLEPGETVLVREILRKRNSGQLEDYLRQLYGLLGGDRWIVLVPDNWEAQWLESILRARPLALPRDKVFLLWRSVAAVLGQMDQMTFPVGSDVVVVDGYTVPNYNAVCVRFMTEKETRRVLPQRSSTRLHSADGSENSEVRFCLDRSFSDHSSPFAIGRRGSLHLCVGILSERNFISQGDGVVYSCNDKILYSGVRRFLEEESRGLVSYFDERDEMWLVVQTRSEEVEFKVLVEHDECSPGGKPYHGAKTRGGALQQGAAKISLNVLEGVRSDTAPLKTLEESLDDVTPETMDIYFQADMMPGQGLATVVFMADFLDEPIPLDLAKLKSSDLTKARIERDMKRHFPPVMPYVEASEAIWMSVRSAVMAYVEHGQLPDNGLFAKAQPYWGTVDSSGVTSYRLFGDDRFFDEETMSPVDKLKRENVFGNAPGKDLPEPDFPWDRLFVRLSADWAAGRNVLRLIAWTYRDNKDVFEPIRKQLHRQYVRAGQSLGTVEATFCANCFAKDDPRVEDFVCRLLSRAANGAIGANEMRLLYNLMQFHPSSLASVDSMVCEQAFMKLYRIYNTHQFYDRYGRWDGAAATRTAGYLLKCMLFMLHRRRWDPGFLKRAEDWQPIGFLAEPLPTHTPTLQGHEAMRRSFLNYVRGHGTIDGIPLGD